MDTRDLLLLAQKALVEVRNLIIETDGVVGLHKNGDVAPWPELINGGDFERLTHLEEALAEVDSALRWWG